MNTINAYTKEYLSLVKSDTNDSTNRRASWDNISASTAIWDGKPIYIDYLPRLYPAHARNFLKSKAETLANILIKIIREYQKNPRYRRLFSFDERLIPLMCAPTNYDVALPLARVDCFFNEETGSLKFCEFNTDGTSGMNENREVLAAICESEPYHAFSKTHTLHTFDDELFDGWVNEFLHIYFEGKKKASATADTNKPAISENIPNTALPHIAIVDYLDVAALEEFKVYGKLFKDRGFNFSVFDVRELSFDGEKLIGKQAAWGKSNCALDIIWRRTVASDVLSHWKESRAYIDAILQKKVTLIGSFATNVVHDKQIFALMRAPETLQLMTEEEQKFIAKHIPFTTFLDSSEANIAHIKAHPEKWVIKPTDGYCSNFVSVGLDYANSPTDKQKWESLVDECLAQTRGDKLGEASQSSTRFLVQEYCKPSASPSLPLYGNEADFSTEPKNYNDLCGLYLISGKFAGIFSRKGPNSLILGREGGITAASVIVE